MRLPFRRTQKPVAPRVYEPGADSPYVPRLGVWMELADAPPLPEWQEYHCSLCGRGPIKPWLIKGEPTESGFYYCEGCGGKVMARLRRERETIA